MTSYDARFRLIGEPGFPLGVEIDLTGERMVVTVDGGTLADWSLNDIKVHSRPDGFHIAAEGEEIILNVTDGARFAREIGSALHRD
jgi:hypothetical protein